MARKNIFVAFALLLVAGASLGIPILEEFPFAWEFSGDSPLWSSPVCRVGASNPIEVSSKWLVPTALAAALIIGVISVVYILSGLQGGVSQSGVMAPAGGFFFATQLTTTRLRAWCKECAFGVVSTFAIIGLLSGAYVGTAGFGANYIDTSIAYAHTIRNTLVVDFMGLTTFSMLVSFLSQTPSFAPWGLGIRFSIAPVLKPIFDMLGIILNMSIASLGEWFAQEFFLCFIRENMLTIFFPMALFLRTFTFTKSLGNSMLALAIAFFFVYPYMITMNMEIVSQKYGHAVTPDGGRECGIMSGQFCIYWTGLGTQIGKALTGTVGPVFDALSNGWSAAIGLVMALSLSLLTTVYGAAIIIGLAGAVPVFLYYIGYMVFIVSLVLPIFNIFVTITIAMELAKFFGTEIDLSAIEKLL